MQAVDKHSCGRGVDPVCTPVQYAIMANVEEALMSAAEVRGWASVTDFLHTLVCVPVETMR